MIAARVMVSLLVGRALFSVVYLSAASGKIPVFLYDPLGRRWASGLLTAPPPGFILTWFGSTGAAIAAGVMGFGLAYGISGSAPVRARLNQRSFVEGVASAVGLMMLVDFLYFGWILTHQSPSPLPLP